MNKVVKCNATKCKHNHNGKCGRYVITVTGDAVGYSLDTECLLYSEGSKEDDAAKSTCVYCEVHGCVFNLNGLCNRESISVEPQGVYSYCDSYKPR